jgi:hypothetical protein
VVTLHAGIQSTVAFTAKLPSARKAPHQSLRDILTDKTEAMSAFPTQAPLNVPGAVYVAHADLQLCWTYGAAGGGTSLQSFACSLLDAKLMAAS